MLELITPDIKYKHSYLEAVKEYQADEENAFRLQTYQNLNVGELYINFEQYLLKIRNESSGINLPEGYVPHTVYWLVDGDTFLGRVDVRHQLNDFLKKEGGHIGYDIRPSERNKGYGSIALQLAIKKAHELGIKEVLITCDVENVGSNKIIQKNGGILENTYSLLSGPVKNRYWIKLI